MKPQPRWIHKYARKPDLWIFVPNQDTIDLGVQIKKAIQEKWSIPSNYFHLQQGGHVAALKHHENDMYFVRLDIEKFFNTINRSRLTRCLKELFDYKTARAYALASAVKHPSKSPITYILPYGFVQSPILASLCLRFSSLGKKIHSISAISSQRVSVYMDDIIISSNDMSAGITARDEIKDAAQKSGFKLNSHKEQGPSNMITVFNIDLRLKHLAVEKNRYHELKSNYVNTSNKHVKHGIASYVSTVNKKQCMALNS